VAPCANVVLPTLQLAAGGQKVPKMTGRRGRKEKTIHSIGSAIVVVQHQTKKKTQVSCRERENRNEICSNRARPRCGKCKLIPKIELEIELTASLLVLSG